MLTGILAPMPEEINLILASLTDQTHHHTGQRNFISGMLDGKPVVVALSRIGKVAAAVTAAIMIEKFAVDKLILTGVAGAIAQQINVGDIVVASACIQHDLDARPLFPRFEAPLLGRAIFDCDAQLVELARDSANNLLSQQLSQHIDQDHIRKFNLSNAKVYSGLLCSGDQFIGSHDQLMRLRTALPQALCVEMEGGALGQVCYEYGVPYVAIRSISDTADHTAHIDFAEYISTVSSHYTLALVRSMLSNF